MKAEIKENVYGDFDDYCHVATVKELRPEYPYNTIEYQDALNALIRNLHKISPSDIWKLIGE